MVSRNPIRTDMGAAVVREIAKQWRAIETTEKGHFISEEARLSTINAAPIVDAVLDVLVQHFPNTREHVELIKAGAKRG